MLTYGEASKAVYPGYLKRIEIHGTEGTAVIETGQSMIDAARVAATSATRPIRSPA
jgi:predicted dehydrogenase